jgi:hypothetical protein
MRSSQSTAGGAATASAGSTANSGNSNLRSGPGQRLPVPPRERKPALAALAVLLILGGALTSAYLVMASGQRVSAIRVAQPVAAGQQIPLSALEEVQIGNTGIDFVAWSARAQVARTYAAVPLVKGELLTSPMTTQDTSVTQGRVTLGLALKPGQLPSQPLANGDHVAVYAVGADGTGVAGGTLLANDAIVQDVRKLGEGTLESNQTRVSLAVPPEQAPALAQAASAGAAAVALVPPGTTVSGPAPSGRQGARQTPGQSGQQGGQQGGQQTPAAQQGGGQQSGGPQTGTPGGG